MFGAHVRMALSSLSSAKIRSFLTMFGVVIGVSSVLIAVSIGQGVKQQVLNQINQLGNDVITIIPGKSFTTDNNGRITGFNSSATQGVSTLTNEDVAAIKSISGVAVVSPSVYISGVASTVEQPNYSGATIIATTADIKSILASKLEFGEFFSEKDDGKKVVVVGSDVANDLFNQRDPIGRSVTIRGETFTVRGVLAEGPESPINVGFNYNTAIYMPMETGALLTKGASQINQITVKVDNEKNAARISNQIKELLLQQHDDQEDFTVIQQEDFLQATNQIFSLLTGFIAAVAGISLFVGGVGIMNIMLVSVSERTREIGIRKAVGATNQQIVGQFLIEAMLLSVIGGIIGIIVSFIAVYFIRLYSAIDPIISFPLIALAFGVSVVIGILFGIAPAIKAATKDPIQALRQL
jgi:ABC-type antimicrobial peptide transport system permease subunit